MDQVTVQNVIDGLEAAGRIFGTLNKTLLVGWHHDNFKNLPTQAEAYDIASIHDELMLMGHFPEDDDTAAWKLAGQLVQRCRRDRSARSI